MYSTLGIHKAPFSGHLSISRVEGACVRASCGEFERTDDSFTVDLAASYRLTDSVGLFARVENVADAEDIIGRHPYGARPNKGRTFSMGVDLAW